MKSLLATILATGVGLLGPTAAWAQYPAKQVRLVIGFAAGGPLDTWTRTIAAPLSERLGVPIIVENRPGAEGALASEAVRKSPADGSAFTVAGAATLASAAQPSGSSSFDPLQEFTPVSLVARFTMVLLTNPAAAESVENLIREARRHPGKINFGTAAPIDTWLCFQLIKASGIVVTRVQYKGAAQMIPDLVAGRIDVAITPLAAGLAHLRDERLRALAVFADDRSDLAPHVPTISQAGLPDVSSPAWVGIFGPAGLPHDVTARVAREMRQVTADPDVRAKLGKQAVIPEASSPEELARLLKRDLALWRESTKESAVAPR